MTSKRKLKVANIDDKDIENKSWANASFTSIKGGQVILEMLNFHVGYQFTGIVWRFEGAQGRCTSRGLSFTQVGTVPCLVGATSSPTPSSPALSTAPKGNVGFHCLLTLGSCSNTGFGFWVLPTNFPTHPYI